MDKEKKTSSAVQCKRQERQNKEPAELHSRSSSSLISPDPCGSNQTLRGNQSGVIPKEIASNINGAPGGQGEVSKSHGYSSSRRVRETSKRNDSLPQGRVMFNNSLDTHKKGFRGTRSTPNSAEKSKPAQANLVPFEVNVSDFPELAVHTPVHRVCWGPTPQPMNPRTQTSLSWKSGRRGSPKQPDSLQIATNAEPDSSTASPVQMVVTSWANVASQPPKKPVPKEKIVNNNTHMQMEEISAQQEDGGKKKRKKKKKRAKGAVEDAEAESDGPAIYQEPPKFEDEEEFPGLTLTKTRNERFITSRNDAKLCNEENQRGVQHQSADETDISPPLKTQPTETAKKGQKTEKVSGKKSKVPVQLDIGNMLAALEKKQQSQKTKQDTKPVILSVGGGLPVVQKQQLVQKKPPWQQDKIAHNPLDSTSPLVKKGKQREVPKAKKPTPLKKVILKEREERKQRRLLEERGLLPELELQPANDAAEEEQCDTNATDVVGSPMEEIDDESEVNATNQMVKDDGEEPDKDESIQQQTITSVPCPANRPKIHSRKFRDYCSQMLSKDVDECVTALLKELVRFQDRLYQKDPMKARMKRRIVMGLREVLKHLKLRKVKCVVISPNCERIQSKGGLDEALYTIIDTCREQGVPFVFALSRKVLGRCVNKAVPVSLVGIFNYDGAQDFYHKMIELSSEARTAYEVMVSSLEWTGQAEEEQAVNSEEGVQISSLAEEAEISPDTTEPEELEHLEIWKKMLEKDCNHTLLNIEEQLSSMCLENECTENTEEERS